MKSSKGLWAICIMAITANAACARTAPPDSAGLSSSASPASAGGAARLTSQSPSATWDDGLAEVAVYDGRWVIYGKERSFEARLITAKEAYDVTRGVKADPPYDGREIRDVLKENLVMEIPTENYPYRYLRTIFVSRDNPDALMKATVGSQEWCGNTFHLYSSEKRPHYQYHSYFDGEGDGDTPLDVRPGDLFRDQLFSTLRFTSRDLGERRIRLWPSWISNHARPVAPMEAILRSSGAETIVADGKNWPCARFTIEAQGLSESYWYSSSPDPVLVRYESSDGRSFLLKEISRRDYWTRH